MRLPSIIVDPALSEPPPPAAVSEHAPPNGVSHASKDGTNGSEASGDHAPGAPAQQAEASSTPRQPVAPAATPSKTAAPAPDASQPVAEGAAAEQQIDASSGGVGAQLSPAADFEESADEQAAGELSDQEADRFAADIRASWEAPPAQPSSRPAPAVSLVPDADDEAAAAEALPDIGAVSLGQRKRAVLWTASAVVGFGALVGLGLLSSQNAQRPDGWQEAGAHAEPVRTAPAAAPPADESDSLAPAETRELEPTAATTEPVGENEMAAAVTASALEPEPGANAPEAEAQAEAAPVEPESAPQADQPAAAPPAEEAAEAPTEADRDAKRRRKPASSRRAQAAPAATVSAPRDDKPALVRIHVTTSPGRAQLTLDGQPVSNPYLVHVPKTSARHRFQAQAEGYKSRSVDVDYARDHSVTLRLRKASSAKPARARKPAEQPSRGAGFVTESPY